MRIYQGYKEKIVPGLYLRKHSIKIGILFCMGIQAFGVTPLAWTVESLPTAPSFGDKEYMARLVWNAERMIDQKQYLPAITFLEMKLQEYAKWRKNPTTQSTDLCDARLPVLYLKLAEAKAAREGASENVIAAYKKVIDISSGNIDAMASSIVWLIGNISQEEFASIIKIIKCKNTKEQMHLLLWKVNAIIISSKQKKSYIRYRGFYNILLISADDKVLFNQIENQLINMDRIVVYQRLIDGGQYETAIIELDQNFPRNKIDVKENNLPADCYVLLAQADLLRARCYMQLDEMGKALDILNALIASTSKIEEVSEATFLIGYIKVLQGKEKEAKDQFNLVIKQYPNSKIASKARLHLNRLERDKKVSV